MAEQTKEWTAMASQQLYEEYQLVRANLAQQNDLLSRLMTDCQQTQSRDLELRHERSDRPLPVPCRADTYDTIDTHTHTHTHTQQFNGLLSGTTRVGRYQKKHSPTHTHPDHRTFFIIFLHLQRSMASSLFSLRA